MENEKIIHGIKSLLVASIPIAIIFGIFYIGSKGFKKTVDEKLGINKK
jgi:hypothetical protein